MSADRFTCYGRRIPQRMDREFMQRYRSKFPRTPRKLRTIKSRGWTQEEIDAAKVRAIELQKLFEPS